MFTWIKQYMPKRLYWRAAFILLFPVIFLQLIVSVVIIKRHFEGVTEQMTGTVASQIKLIATTVEAAEIDAAIELSEALNMKLLAVEPISLSVQTASVFMMYQASLSLESCTN